jgi:uncharacterized UPF0160 family protein
MNKIKLVTHNGLFHADEVFAFIILKIALKYNENDFSITRTRDPDTIKNADYVWDVGMEYDHNKKRYDHHMNDCAKRDDINETPYSAFGLIFLHYGKLAIENYMKSNNLPYAENKDLIEYIFKQIDNEIVKRIDEQDNGIKKGSLIDISALIEEFNPRWNRVDKTSAHEDLCFLKAVNSMETIIENKFEKQIGKFLSKKKIQAAYDEALDKRILVLETGMPWQGYVIDNELKEVLFTIFPNNEGNWVISTVPDKLRSFNVRMSFPEEWKGLTNEDLEKKSGIKDALFVHKALFIGGAKTKEAALKMIYTSISLEEKLKNQLTI